MLGSLDELKRIPQLGAGEKDDAAVPLVKEFLVRFGYLPRISDPISIIDDETMEAVNRYQRFFGLEVKNFISEETRLSMGSPRCGRSDFISATRGDIRPSRIVSAIGRRWLLCEVLFKLGDPPSGITRTQARDSVEAALAIWRQQVPLGFGFREVGAGDAAHLLIDWVASASVPGVNFAVREIFAYGDPPPDGGGTVRGAMSRMLFDANLPWSVIHHDESFHLLTVALHEVGHILGLEHCGGDSVMNPNIGRGRGRVALRPVDRQTAEELYRNVVCQ